MLPLVSSFRLSRAVDMMQGIAGKANTARLRYSDETRELTGRECLNKTVDTKSVSRQVCECLIIHLIFFA